MSLGFELAQSGGANQYANAFGESKPADQLSPSTFEGVGRGIGMGVMKGGAAAARAASLAVGVLPVLQDKLTGGTALSDIYFERHDRIFNRATEYWTPRPDEVGSAGRILGGVAEMALPLMVGGGNPTLLIGSTGLGTGEDLVRQGVDATTARAVGTVQAAAIAAGFKIPFLGRNLAERVAFGAGSNVAIGAGAAAASAGTLAKEGYAAQAAQFDPFDAEARAIDVLMGAVFGGIAHVTAPKRARTAQDVSIAADLTNLPENGRDAVLTANNARHADVETAPGRPRTLDAQNDHADALAQAMDELDAGVPVTAQVPRESFDASPRQDSFKTAVSGALDEARGGELSVAAHETPVADVVAQEPANIEPKAAPVAPTSADGKINIPPEITAAERIVAENPDLPIVHDDGTVTRAADALAKADEVIAQAQTEAKAFDAAVACVLRG